MFGFEYNRRLHNSLGYDAEAIMPTFFHESHFRVTAKICEIQEMLLPRK